MIRVSMKCSFKQHQPPYLTETIHYITIRAPYIHRSLLIMARFATDIAFPSFMVRLSPRFATYIQRTREVAPRRLPLYQRLPCILSRGLGFLPALCYLHYTRRSQVRFRFFPLFLLFAIHTFYIQFTRRPRGPRMRCRSLRTRRRPRAGTRRWR